MGFDGMGMVYDEVAHVFVGLVVVAGRVVVLAEMECVFYVVGLDSLDFAGLGSYESGPAGPIFFCVDSDMVSL